MNRLLCMELLYPSDKGLTKKKKVQFMILRTMATTFSLRRLRVEIDETRHKSRVCMIVHSDIIHNRII